MSKLIDLTGRRFGLRTVLARVPAKGPARWRVRCDCGTEDIVRSQNLRNGTANSCHACANRKNTRLIDLSGQRFGRWVVTGRASRESGAAHWHVRCDCGRTSVVSSQGLRNGRSTQCRSCGHVKYDYKADLSSVDWCWLLGLFHGVGSTWKDKDGGGNVTFASTSQENRNVIRAALTAVGIKEGVGETRNGVHVYSVRLASDLGRFKVSGRDREGWMFPEHPSHWTEWLAGLLDADGWVRKDGCRARYYQKRHGGFDWASKALTRLGIQHTRRPRSDRPQEEIYICTRSMGAFRDLVHPRFPKKARRIERVA